MCYNRAMPATHAGGAFPLTACPLSWRPSRAHIKKTRIKPSVRPTFCRLASVAVGFSACRADPAAEQLLVLRVPLDARMQRIHASARSRVHTYIRHPPPSLFVVTKRHVSMLYIRPAAVRPNVRPTSSTQTFALGP